MVCYAGKQEKSFWFSSLDQIEQFGAIIFCRTFKNYFGQFVWIEKTRRERPKSAPYLWLKNIQGTTIGNIWKNYFFQKKFEIFFSKKSIFFRKSHNAEKLKKRPFRLIKRFYKPKTSKKMQLIDSENFRKKVA